MGVVLFWLFVVGAVVCCWGGCLLVCFWVFPLVFVVLHLMHKDVIYPRLSPSS